MAGEDRSSEEGSGIARRGWEWQERNREVWLSEESCGMDRTGKAGRDWKGTGWTSEE